RQKKAYPVYDDNYARHVAAIRAELEERYPNLYLVGRNGMHKYNNQDHAMMTAMLCVENILAEEKLYDLWQVNGDAEYHETEIANAKIGMNFLGGSTRGGATCGLCVRALREIYQSIV